MLFRSFEYTMRRNSGLSWSLKLLDPDGIFKWMNNENAPWLTPDHNYMIDDKSSALINKIENTPAGSYLSGINLPITLQQSFYMQIKSINDREDLSPAQKTELIREIAEQVYAEAGVFQQHFILTKKIVATIYDTGGNHVLPSLVIKN